MYNKDIIYSIDEDENYVKFIDFKTILKLLNHHIDKEFPLNIEYLLDSNGITSPANYTIIPKKIIKGSELNKTEPLEKGIWGDFYYLKAYDYGSSTDLTFRVDKISGVYMRADEEVVS